MSYPWYEDVAAETPVEQGDIIEKCSIILPNAESYNAILSDSDDAPSMEVIMINGIVMSQSCDISNNKINSIIVCPVRSLSDLLQENSGFNKETLRQGNFPSYHLLNRFSTDFLPDDFYFVDFHHIYSIPKTFIEGIISSKSRKRLLPPYREHLSQSFARYFMRVGLPSDISKEEIKNYKPREITIEPK